MRSSTIPRQLPTRPPTSARGTLPEQVRALRKEVTKLTAENEALRSIALVDPLTGLANRRGFDEAIERETRTALRYNGPLTAIMIDLDGMKRLNDECGHSAGDAALRIVGEIIRRSVRASDCAARLGGDEFAIIMPATDGPGAYRVAERIRERVAAMSLPSGHKLTASIGIASLGGGADIDRAASDMIERADATLYKAKRGGRNRVLVAVTAAAP